MSTFFVDQALDPSLLIDLFELLIPDPFGKLLAPLLILLALLKKDYNVSISLHALPQKV